MSLLRKKKTIKLNKSLKKLHHRLSRIIFDQPSGSPIAQPSSYMKLTTLGPSSGRQQEEMAELGRYNSGFRELWWIHGPGQILIKEVHGKRILPGQWRKLDCGLGIK